MYQLVAIGDITIDLYFRGKDITQDGDRFALAIGGKYYSENFHVSLGGSAANVAIHAASFGLDSAAVATVGENAFKNIIVQTLSRKSVSTEFLHFIREHTSISSILLAESGERTVIKYSDPHDHIYLSEHAIDRIQKSKAIFVGNVSDVPVKERITLLKAIKTEENIIAMNFSSQECEKGAAGLKEFLDLTDVLILNKYELATLLGEKPDKLDLTKTLLSKIGGSVKLLLVTDSSQGSYAHTADTVVYQEAAAVPKVVDTTGAGDSFSAAFLARYADTKDVAASLKAGSEHAAKVIGAIGAN